MEIQMRKIGEVIPYEHNPRRNDHAVDAVAASIREFGFKVPIVVDKDGVIVAGHTRLKAAVKLGLEEVPCVVADDLSEDQVKAFRLADNKVGELAAWDFTELEKELAEIDIDMSAFGFPEAEDWFNRTEKDGTARQEGNDEYNDFLEKFEAKKTTDDCYTPDNIYEVVASWVETEYGKDRADFVRPFYPNGDYQKYRYGEKSVVVDNPPFSILAEIIDFYVEKRIKFFLFAPALAVLNYTTRAGVCAVNTYAGVTYENGACVSTSFLTNLNDPEIIARSVPDLYAAIEEANDENEKAMRTQLPKYEFPDEVLTSAKFGWLAKYGQSMNIRRSDCVMIRQLDAMKESGKGIYGNALLLSEELTAERAAAERAAAERAAAERAAATKWKLSDREREIVRSLGKDQADD